LTIIGHRKTHRVLRTPCIFYFRHSRCRGTRKQCPAAWAM